MKRLLGRGHFSLMGAILLITVTIMQYSCRSNEQTQETAIDALVGQWKLPFVSQEHRVFIEEWSKQNDSTFTGAAYALNQNTGDRFNNEKLYIEYRDNNWVYIAEPAGQQKTKFKLSELTPEHFRFVNPGHDFPQYIEYRWITPDSLVAEIGDTSRSRSFPMIRLKPDDL